ncbi:MAG TPA: acyltransferase family protein [Myxococcales bacterium]|nr:acyltransferase family protein [Myxococcales bacterium]
MQGTRIGTTIVVWPSQSGQHVVRMQSARQEDPSLAPPTSISANETVIPTRLEYNAGLDGLRGIGLLAILFYHSGVNWIPGGFLSVSTFFTLSGFLITSLLLYEWDQTGGINLAAFWRHRFRRLMPGALLALAVIAVLGATIGDDTQIARLRGDGLAALFYVSNWRFVYLGSDYADIFASPSLVQHFWSLSIEEQFYLTFPIVAMGLLRFGHRRLFGFIVVTAAIASTIWMAILFDPEAPTSRLYFGTDTRAAEILLGTLLALWHAGRPRLTGNGRQLAIAIGVLGLAGNLYYWFGVSMETAWLWRGGYLIYAISTAAIILGTLQSAGPTHALLSWGPLPWLGKLSYGVYIYHFSFYVTLTPELTGLDPWPLFATRVAVTFALAVPSYYFFEQPIRRGKLLTGRKFWFALPMGMTAVVALIILATLHPPKTAINLRELTDTERLVINDGTPRVLVVGGSISYGIGNGLLRWASETGRASVLNAAIEGCGIARGGRLVNSLKRDADRCDHWPDVWTSRLDAFDPDVVVVLVSGWDTTDRIFPRWGPKARQIGDPLYDRWLISEYEVALDLLTSRGARVSWLTAPCLATRNGGKGVWDPQRPALLNQVLARLVENQTDRLELLDFNAKVCPDEAFTNQLAGMTGIRPDGAHLSDEAADWTAQWLGDLVVSSERPSQ